MSLLEEISNMNEQGISEEEIITALQERGVSPKDIKDALNQLKIKNAISDYESNEENLFADSNQEEPSQGYAEQRNNTPTPAYHPQQSSQEMYTQQAYPEQGENYQEEEYSPATGIDSNSIIEISEQVFSEKIKLIRKDLDSFNEFKNITQIRMENLNERLKRIETVFDKLQITILEKIGSYGQNLEVIKKEMEMMQNSFSKIVEPLVDNAEKKQEKEIKNQYFPVKKSQKIVRKEKRFKK
jgi:hypothetical protein